METVLGKAVVHHLGTIYITTLTLSLSEILLVPLVLLNGKSTKIDLAVNGGKTNYMLSTSRNVCRIDS